MSGSVSKVIGLMAAAIIFSVIGAETSPAPVSGQKSPTKDPFTIIIGGTIGAAILALISELGEVGQTIGVGFAGLAAVTATLVNGKPAWQLIEKITNGKDTAPLTTPTGGSTSTGSTNPTGTTAGTFGRTVNFT